VVIGAALPRASEVPLVPHPGGWAALASVHPDLAAAERAAMLAAPYRHAWPLALVTAGGVELWYAGFGNREAALAFRPGAPVRELSPEEQAGGDLRTAAVRRRFAGHLGGAVLGKRFALASPLPRFALAAEALGGVSQEVERDGRILALRHVYPTADGDYLSLSLAAAWLARGKPPIRVEDGRLRFGNTLVPLTSDARVLLRWRGPFEGGGSGTTYPQVSAAVLLRAALARDGEGEALPAALLAPLAGAVAVVAPAVAGGKDQHPTPVDPRALGGEVVANGIDDLLRGEFVRRVPRLGEAALGLGFSVALGLLAAFLAGGATRPRVAVARSLAGVAAALAGWWGLCTAALLAGLWLPAALPLAGGLLAALATEVRLFALERADRRFIHDALGRYTSPALVRELLQDPELLDRFGGRREELTVYFSDIRGFTSVSEGLAAEKLVELLNAYLSEMTEVVERYGGYVDKYVGDAIMALWGAPVPARDHAARACAAALEMRDRLAELRPLWKERFGVEIFARAGINTGPMVAGNIGSARKTNYTVLGDGVNLASRLEGANKVYGTELLVGEGTMKAAGETVEVRSIDVVRVKGKTRGVRVYELLGMKGALGAGDRTWLGRWEEAVAAYRARRFDEALLGFQETRRARPGDPVSRFYVERCAAFLVAPPPREWDGVHELHEK
jgi:adenylate cyclase